MSASAETQRPTSANDVAASEVDREFACRWLLEVLDSLKRTIQNEQVYHGQHMMRRAEGQRNGLLVPQEAELNRLMRYEDHLSRHRDRDELALERMQRMRRGEKVPPPTARI